MRTNPLEEYRRAQRAIRREFDAFTRAHCATCPTPCCRKPARIAPTDILLARGVGWRPPEGVVDEVERAAGEYIGALAADPIDEAAPAPPCEFLGATGCTFPRDLRPYGCTAYICRIMHEHMDRMELARVKRLVRDLERAHVTLMSYLHRARGPEEGEE